MCYLKTGQEKMYKVKIELKLVWWISAKVFQGCLHKEGALS